MSDTSIDILMITYNRPEYTRLSLQRLLRTCDDSMRVWVWHNGTDEETLETVRSLEDHPRFHQFHHSPENVKLDRPTNWLWENSVGAYVAKVDDDCLVPEGWAGSLRSAHESTPELGVVACWHFCAEDYDPELSKPKVRKLNSDHALLLNCWVGGSGYLMKRRCIEENGLLNRRRNWTRYCIELSTCGWVNGWHLPLLCQEHMDDPRSANTLLKSDADLHQHLPLSAARTGATSLADWQAQLEESARFVQRASPDPRAHIGWRRRLRDFTKRVWKRG